MKTTRFVMIFVAAAAMMFASCDKDSDTTTGNGTPDDNQLSQTEQMIVGSWNENEVLYIYTQGGGCDTTSMFEEGEYTEITFNADKTYSSVYHSIDGDSEDHGTWSVSGNTITMTDEFGPMNYNIDQLDASVFNITYNNEGEDEDGPYTLNIIIRMTRK